MSNFHVYPTPDDCHSLLLLLNVFEARFPQPGPLAQNAAENRDDPLEASEHTISALRATKRFQTWWSLFDDLTGADPFEAGRVLPPLGMFPNSSHRSSLGLIQIDILLA